MNFFDLFGCLLLICPCSLFVWLKNCTKNCCICSTKFVILTCYVHGDHNPSTLFTFYLGYLLSWPLSLALYLLLSWPITLLTLTPDLSDRIREDMCGLDEITQPPEPVEVRLASRYDTSTPHGGVDILHDRDDSLNTVLLAGRSYIHPLTPSPCLKCFHNPSPIVVLTPPCLLTLDYPTLANLIAIFKFLCCYYKSCCCFHKYQCC